MMEMVHERDMAMTDNTGKAYVAVRVYADEQSGGTWAGILEFLPADGGPAVRTDRETTQMSPDAVAYWATGLEPVYFEGAMDRALRQPVTAMPTRAPALPVTGRRIARVEIETADPQLPLRVMATRTLVRGFRRRIHNAGTIVYEGPTRPDRYAFLVQFGTENAAAMIANVVWTEARDVGQVSVEGIAIDNTHAALKDALLAVTSDRLAG